MAAGSTFVITDAELGLQRRQLAVTQDAAVIALGIQRVEGQDHTECRTPATWPWTAMMKPQGRASCGCCRLAGVVVKAGDRSQRLAFEIMFRTMLRNIYIADHVAVRIELVRSAPWTGRLFARLDG